jgi:hypothetical protein
MHTKGLPGRDRKAVESVMTPALVPIEPPTVLLAPVLLIAPEAETLLEQISLGSNREDSQCLSMSEAGIDSVFWSERCRSPIPSTCVPE